MDFPKKLACMWLSGAKVIPFSMLGCFLTCVAGVASNSAYEARQLAWSAFLVRLVVAYSGAALVVVIVFPLLDAFRKIHRKRQLNSTNTSSAKEKSPVA